MEVAYLERNVGTEPVGRNDTTNTRGISYRNEILVNGRREVVQEFTQQLAVNQVRLSKAFLRVGHPYDDREGYLLREVRIVCGF